MLLLSLRQLRMVFCRLSANICRGECTVLTLASFLSLQHCCVKVVLCSVQSICQVSLQQAHPANSIFVILIDVHMART